VSLAARERLRNHHAAAGRAVAAYLVATSRLDAVKSRRAEIVAGQDTLVAAGSAEVARAIAGIVQVVGVETAAGLLEVSTAEVRRVTKDAS
jgi:hypothetical protein